MITDSLTYTSSLPFPSLPFPFSFLFSYYHHHNPERIVVRCSKDKAREYATQPRGNYQGQQTEEAGTASSQSEEGS